MPEANRNPTDLPEGAPGFPTRDPATWESAVVVRVPELDATIKHVRERFDLPRKPNGIAPHITVIVPFLPLAMIDEAARVTIREILTGIEPFEVRFARTGRFPTVLYLDPEPAQVFRALTTAITTAWPALRPYGGSHRDPVPHLTVTTSRSRSLLSRVAAAVEPLLPVSARVAAAQLYRFDGRRWTEIEALPLGSGARIQRA